jgi:hypothetical protein
MGETLNAKEQIRTVLGIFTATSERKNDRGNADKDERILLNISL